MTTGNETLQKSVPAIRIQGLSKRYGEVVALDGLDLTVDEGEMFALLGVNGAGKTTTVKILSGLTAPDAGDAFLAGNSVCTAREAVKQIVNVSPQETAVAARLSVRENLRFIAGIYGFTGEEAAKRVENILSEMGLSEVAERRASTLSGGWQRRVSIAMALISEPRILFLDEPTLGLDVIARHELWRLVKTLKGKITVILTTHYLEEAEQFCDRIAILSKGKLLTVGTAEEIKALAGCDKFEDAFVKLSSGEVTP